MKRKLSGDETVEDKNNIIKQHKENIVPLKPSQSGRN
jgi:hypothetical protein